MDTSRPSLRPCEILSLVALSAVLSAAAAPPPPPDLVLLNGAILLYQGIEQKPGGNRSAAPAKGSAPAKGTAAAKGAAPARPAFAQAIAITDGRIVFVGPDRKAKRLAGPATRVVDLGGRMVMPGIVDGHFHGTRPTDCEMGYAGGTVAEVLAKLQACLDRPDQAPFKGSN
ncbi:MAG TPA: hypothetical protein VN898_05430, partial [Candidatus Binatia bacterium]|nr:hypothetical protein [Candidatus Binatia bacterium]